MSSAQSDHPGIGHLVSLTKRQMEHLLELIEHGTDLPTGRNRRAALRAKLTVALQTKPTPVFPEESE